ncbi:MAG: metal ABC transporter solute-binding protein, Zn/Mn family [Gaiellaceae bacterium]
MALIIVVAAAGCGGEEDTEKTRVAAAFYPIAYAAKRVGGEGIEVYDVTPPGAEPHDVELSARDVRRLRESDVVLYLGGGFQPALENAAEDTEGRAVDLAGPGRDRHVWLDPVRYAGMVERIGVALGRRQATGGLVAELRRLDGEFRRGLARCRRRDFVTSHAAFGYLARRYGLQQIAISGQTPEAEPSPQELERVVDLVRAHDATTIFFEPLVSDRLADTIARETGARTAALNPLEGLTENQLDRGEDYFSLMRANLRALREALGCS